ncbi:MAG TPA: PfkB family carbohydrate kinase [Gaiellaceae bacterium]|nr:PfkB family carbohydrate kinase [Gaiellaceae bacterium]
MPVTFTAVGDVMLDLGLTSGSEPHDAVIQSTVGGTAVNAAVWAAEAGAEATCVGRVGIDAGALAVRGALAARGVAAALAADPGERTGAVAFVDGDLLVDRGANRRLSPADLRALDADAVLVSGYVLLHEDSGPAGRAALRGGARWTGVTAGSVDLVRRRGLAALVGARVLVANAAEARALTGAEPEEAVRALAGAHELACVTLGPDGALLAHGGDLFRATSPSIAGLAHGGAGDAFAATLLVALAAGAAPADALETACRAGSAAAGSADGWP